MSYREVRNLIEMLMALGYPRLVSMENFKNPNFSLVAEIMRWLAHRYDENVEIPTDIDTSQDRVFFVKTIAQFMASKAHIRLNTKKLYQADSGSVREMLKVVGALYEALKSSSGGIEGSSSEQNLLSFDVSAKLSDLKEVRRLASEITSKGALLYDVLQQEPDLRERRLEVLNNPLEIADLEKKLQKATKQLQTEVARTSQMLGSVSADESNLDAKIEQRRAELERGQKRLLALHSVRPAYQDEFERLEQDLTVLYQEYVLKFRNLTLLEQQLDDLRRNEEERLHYAEQKLRRVADRLKEERRLRAAADVGDDLDQLLDEDDDKGTIEAKARRLVGSMGAGDEEDDDVSGGEADLTLGSEGDSQGDGDEDDESADVEEDDADEFSTELGGAGGRGRPGAMSTRHAGARGAAGAAPLAPRGQPQRGGKEGLRQPQHQVADDF